ncbi:MAG: hypothetical protein IJM84_00870 [Bacteroidaceae bacterium]|uniref:Uncharacterized protein n=1 Tax=Pseudoprevotella muciniphila TaxID=2133944 RepID=A0A5P8E5L4_9BACT|nr:hypothetical protein [Pseudoprevotella muciniphila]MBQ7056482.1 hypothetical protein [Bacteroidaceae bacterium]MBQ7664419.1 hypothetical protein [Bacteroidaceae bacterium]QFQ12295.1 hypothetical protein C7Y71_004300 [Pseudoprevotella muciniphila]
MKTSVTQLYPVWLLILAGINLLSLLLSVFFLFGGFGNGFWSYLLWQLAWIAPICCFFGSLKSHDMGKTWLAVIVALAGIAIMCFGTMTIFSK